MKTFNETIFSNYNRDAGWGGHRDGAGRDGVTQPFIITGCVLDETMGDEVRVTVLATGFPGQSSPGSLFASEPVQERRPQQRSVSSGGLPPGPSAQAATARAESSDLDIPPFLRNQRRS